MASIIDASDKISNTSPSAPLTRIVSVPAPPDKNVIDVVSIFVSISRPFSKRKISSPSPPKYDAPSATTSVSLPSSPWRSTTPSPRRISSKSVALSSSIPLSVSFPPPPKTFGPLLIVRSTEMADGAFS